MLASAKQIYLKGCYCYCADKTAGSEACLQMNIYISNNNNIKGLVHPKWKILTLMPFQTHKAFVVVFLLMSEESNSGEKNC